MERVRRKCWRLWEVKHSRGKGREGGTQSYYRRKVQVTSQIEQLIIVAVAGALVGGGLGGG